MTPANPRFAMISSDIRRDLVAPLRALRRLRLTHFYRTASYGDMNAEDFGPELVRYRTPSDLWRSLLQAKADIIQGPEPFAPSLLPFLVATDFASRRLGTPLAVITMENRPLEVRFRPILTTLVKPYLGLYLRRARVIFYLNEGSRRNLLVAGARPQTMQRAMYGTWGIDPAEWTLQRDGREPDWHDAPRILYVGRLDPLKGVFDLADAFARLRQAHPQARLIYIGDGPARQDLATRAQPGIELLGSMKNRDLPPYFRAATLVASPSRWHAKGGEQVGMTNIQAMACAVPVVSTRVGAIPEFVPEGVAGLLVDEGDLEGLAAAMARLITDGDLRRRMGQAGRSYALAHYDAEANVRRAEETLLAVLAQKEGQ